MLPFIIATVLLLLALCTIVLRKTYFYLPFPELKRQAAVHDPVAKVLFRAVAYGESLDVLLWIIIGASVTGSLVLFVRLAPVIFGSLIVALCLWFAFAWLPGRQVGPSAVRLSVIATPLVAGLLNYLHKPLDIIIRIVRKYVAPISHTGLYEREDLITLLEQQKSQGDSRIPVEELDLTARVLRFGDAKVRDLIVPESKVKMLSIDEPVGPILLKELHDSGFTRFPVFKDERENIVGMLRLIDITGAKQGGSVKQFAYPRVTYVHEADTLARLLQVFYQSKEHLFIVVNSFKEFAGIITIEDVLTHLLGELPKQELIEYENPEVVASQHGGPSKNAAVLADEQELEDSNTETNDHIEAEQHRKTEDKVVE